jgi:cell division protein FtsB
MKLVIISILLFFVLFVLAIPMKMANNELADLLRQEKTLEDSLDVLRYRLDLEQRSIDSLKSRERIEEKARHLDLDIYVPAIKIMGGTK